MGPVFPSALLVALGALAFTSSDLSFRVGGWEVMAADVAGELRGGGIRLEVRDGQCRGELFSAPVSLDWEDGAVSGTMGGEAVAFQVRQTGASLIYDGTVGGRRASGVLAPQLVTTTMGQCSAALGAGWSGYEGVLDCGGVTAAQPFGMSFPRSLSSAPPEAQAVLAALLMWAAESFQGVAPEPPDAGPSEAAGAPDAGAAPESR